MSKFQKFGGTAALLNALVGVATLFVAFGLIGPAALTDRNAFIEMALHNPLPIYLQDVLKFVSLGITVVLILALAARFPASRARSASVLVGGLSALCLAANASVSLYATSQTAQLTAETGMQLNGLISVLALASVFFSGIWYLLVSWLALKQPLFPRPLNYLGLGIGAIGLVPPLAILLLLLSIVWSVWLARVWGATPPAA